LRIEVPSNFILHRVGARLWIARIMISCGPHRVGTDGKAQLSSRIEQHRG
jgi:hypothetical protein